MLGFFLNRRGATVNLPLKVYSNMLQRASYTAKTQEKRDYMPKESKEFTDL